MAIAPKVSDLFIDRGIDYHVVPHPYTENSVESAQYAHVNLDRLAKAVAVASGSGVDRRFRLAVLPASRDIDLKALTDICGEHVELAHEYELTVLFPDCAVGAIPVLGAAYHLDTIVDNALERQDEVYFEAGDHEELIRINADQFRNLMENAEFADFSHDPQHDEFRV